MTWVTFDDGFGRPVYVRESQVAAVEASAALDGDVTLTLLSGAKVVVRGDVEDVARALVGPVTFRV